MGNPVAVDILGSIGTKRAAEAIPFGKAVEYRAAKTVGVHFGTILDDCQTAWTAQANVTSTAEAAARKVNARGGKHVIATGFATGLIATYDFAAKDLSGYDRVGFWIYSDIALAAGVLQFVMDETAACASPDETLDIPALAAGVWRYVELKFTGAGSTRDAIVSVGLKAASDPGAATVYIDDIRAGNQFLGIADEDQGKDAYAQYDPVKIIDQGKADVGLAAAITCRSGEFLRPVGSGMFAPDTSGTAGGDGDKTLYSRVVAVEDQANAAGTVPGRLI